MIQTIARSTNRLKTTENKPASKFFNIFEDMNGSTARSRTAQFVYHRNAVRLEDDWSIANTY
jgi:hypothetical protein